MTVQISSPAKGISVRGKIYRMLAVLFAFMLLCTAGYMAYSQRALVEQLVERQASDLADSYFDNINTLMLTGGMANRDIPRGKLLSRPEVLDARVIRGKSITKMYGPGSDYANAVDELDRRGLSGETIMNIGNGADGRVLTVVMPLPASNDFRGTDCISCHLSAEGEVLGAVRVDYSLSALDAALNRDLLVNIGINSALMVAGLLLVGMQFSRIVSNPLNKLTRLMRSVAEGRADWSQRLEVKSRDEIGALAGHFNTAIEKFGRIIDETKHQSEAATRLKTALDCVSTNVMVADKDCNIIYMNRAARRMFSNARHDLRERLPNFDPDDLIGRSIDVFHADPGHQRRLLTTLDDTYESQVRVGPRTFRIIANPVIDAEGQRLGTAVEWADLTAALNAADEETTRLEEERRIATENLRIRTALDNVNSPVMVVDEGHNIIYLNNMLANMFREAEPELRRVIPAFDASTLLGRNMDIFHENSNHQRHLLENMNESVSRELEVAGLTLRLIANPVLNDRGERLGTVLEWANRTAEVAVEKEIDEIVASARDGRLGDRIELQNKRGFFLQLGKGINELVVVIESVFDDIAQAMGRMAEGDMTRPIKRDYGGAFGKVKEDVNATAANIDNILRELRDATDAITNGTGEISAGNTNLSSRTEQQASALQQTAASMEELTSTVRHNAENAQQANQLATRASQIAKRGGDVVGRAVEAMGEINRSSNRIAEIIGVIDVIAFQTNLLALNASVEAARAGEQGRGFAVVATEVRNLAGRSATSAKEIKSLIQDSVAKVQAGAKLVDESGKTLDEIVAGVKQVGDIIAEIATASAEQSAGIDQINRAVTSMDEVTQHNAALAEQTAAASASMSDKAREMTALVEFFKVSYQPRTAPAHAAAIPRRKTSKSVRTPVWSTIPINAPNTAYANRTSPPEDDDEWEEF